MEEAIGKNVLITTGNWFVAPDGRQYKSVWGKLIQIKEASKHLGFVPNRAHANWYICIGNMTIMGCQAMYFIVCPEKPHLGVAPNYSVEAGVVKLYDTPSFIYNANIEEKALPGLSLVQARNKVARRYEYKSWSALVADYKGCIGIGSAVYDQDWERFLREVSELMIK